MNTFPTFGQDKMRKFSAYIAFDKATNGQTDTYTNKDICEVI